MPVTPPASPHSSGLRSRSAAPSPAARRTLSRPSSFTNGRVRRGGGARGTSNAGLYNNQTPPRPPRTSLSRTSSVESTPRTLSRPQSFNLGSSRRSMPRTLTRTASAGSMTSSRSRNSSFADAVRLAEALSPSRVVSPYQSSPSYLRTRSQSPKRLQMHSRGPSYGSARSFGSMVSGGSTGSSYGSSHSSDGSRSRSSSSRASDDEEEEELVELNIDTENLRKALFTTEPASPNPPRRERRRPIQWQPGDGLPLHHQSPPFTGETTERCSCFASGCDRTNCALPSSLGLRFLFFAVAALFSFVFLSAAFLTMTCDKHVEIRDMTGKVVVLTHATSGLGLLQARKFLEWNATVVLGVPSVKKAQPIVSELQALAPPSATVTALQLDMLSLSTVFTFAAELRKIHTHIDVLVNNADVLGHLPPELTDDGHEKVFQLNYLGHFMLSMKMLPLLSAPREEHVLKAEGGWHEDAKGPPASRILNVISDGHFHGLFRPADLDCAKQSCFSDAHLRGDFGAQEYANTQLLLAMLSMKIQRFIDDDCPLVAEVHGGEHAPSPVVTYALHPSNTAAGFPWEADDFWSWFGHSAQLPCVGADDEETAANLVLHLASHPDLGRPNSGGAYYSMNQWPLVDCDETVPARDCARRHINPVALEHRLQDELFAQTCRMAGMNEQMCTILFVNSACGKKSLPSKEGSPSEKRPLPPPSKQRIPRSGRPNEVGDDDDDSFDTTTTHPNPKIAARAKFAKALERAEKTAAAKARAHKAAAGQENADDTDGAGGFVGEGRDPDLIGYVEFQKLPENAGRTPTLSEWREYRLQQHKEHVAALNRPAGQPCVGEWSSWADGTPRSCDGTKTSRVYSVKLPATEGGTPCPAADGAREHAFWNGPCPCEGSWSPWSAGVPRSCDEAPTRRTYVVERPASEGGQSCPVAPGTIEHGYWSGPCPCDGAWTQWTAGVPRSCDNAPTSRTFQVFSAASPGGHPCVASEGDKQSGWWSDPCPR